MGFGFLGGFKKVPFGITEKTLVLLEIPILVILEEALF